MSGNNPVRVVDDSDLSSILTVLDRLWNKRMLEKSDVMLLINLSSRT